MNLDDVRGSAPITDRAAYEAAYREAELSGTLAELAHRLWTSTGLSSADLAKRLCLPEEDLVAVEDGSAVLGIVDLLDRLGRVIGEEGELRMGTVRVLLGQPGPPRKGPAGRGQRRRGVDPGLVTPEE